MIFLCSLQSYFHSKQNDIQSISEPFYLFVFNYGFFPRVFYALCRVWVSGMPRSRTHCCWCWRSCCVTTASITTSGWLITFGSNKMSLHCSVLWTLTPVTWSCTSLALRLDFEICTCILQFMVGHWNIHLDIAIYGWTLKSELGHCNLWLDIEICTLQFMVGRCNLCWTLKSELGHHNLCLDSEICTWTLQFMAGQWNLNLVIAICGWTVKSVLGHCSLWLDIEICT